MPFQKYILVMCLLRNILGIVFTKHFADKRGNPFVSAIKWPMVDYFFGF